MYRKTHIPTGQCYEEKFYFTPGDTGFKVFDTKAGKVGIKKPGAATAAAAPAAEAGAEGEVSDLPPVGDIPDMPPANAVAMYTNAPASSM